MFEIDNSIYDNLHGFVDLTAAEVEIIGSPYFQRLRDIKQLGPAYFVFPGAVHTRYAHSVGVLHIMSVIIKEMQKKGIVFPDNNFEKNLRMSALLHDIGHYPLSHSIERAYMDHERDIRTQTIMREFMVVSSSEGDTKNDYAVNDEDVEDGSSNKHEYGHERLSEFIVQNTTADGGITNILEKHGFSADDVREISTSIVGNCLYPIFNELLHSEFDVDRCDYLLRDAQATGSTYGVYDYDFLVRHISLVNRAGIDYKDLDFNGTNGLRNIFTDLDVVIDSAALFTVEHFLLARYFWYSQIVYNRTNLIYDLMVKKIYKYLLKIESVFSYQDIKDLIKNNKTDEYIRFNDVYFWQKVYELIDQTQDLDEEKLRYKKLAKLVLNRQHFKKVDAKLMKYLTKKNIRTNNSNKGVIDENDYCSIETHKCHVAKGREILDRVNAHYSEKGIDHLWAIKKTGDVDILQAFDEFTKVEGGGIVEDIKSHKQPIRIKNKFNGKVEYLVNMPQSIMKSHSQVQLVLPRIYVEREYLEEINKLIDSIDL